jgi:hypothetical protein
MPTEPRGPTGWTRAARPVATSTSSRATWATYSRSRSTVCQTDGSTVYVTLYSLVGAQWLGNSYTYTAYNASGALGVMQTPTPGSILSGNIATFTWSAGTGATAYWLDIGSVPGGNQYYQSGNLGNVLTTTVYSLPIDGSTIYATLYSYVGGQWLSTAYTYVSNP